MSERFQQPDPLAIATVPVSSDSIEKAGPELLEPATYESALAVIRAEFPAVDIQSSRLIKLANPELANDNIVVEVNGDRIFKFPSKNAVMAQREEGFLKLLEGKTTAAAPKVLYAGEKTSCFGTDKMQGEHLTADLYEQMSGAEKDALADDIALFLREMHTKVPVEEAGRIGIQEDTVDRTWPLERLQGVIDTKAGDDDGFKAFLTSAAEAYHAVPRRETEQKVFLHHDLSDGNLFLDPDTKRLKGIIDFGNVATGDRYIDFASLYRNRPEFGLRVASKYAELTGEAIDLERVSATGIIKEITHLIQSPKKREESLKRLKEWYEQSRL